MKDKIADAAKALAAAQAAERETLKAQQAAQNEQKALTAQIEARFPPDKLFRVPQDCELAQKYPAYREDHPAAWADMLQRYPTAPRNDEERGQREAGLWKLYADEFTAKDADGKARLKPKQYILDYFENNEKWILRYYYAATGVLKKTIQEEAVRVSIASKQAVDRLHVAVKKGRNISSYQQEADRTFGAFERVIREQIPAHFRKEGEWFFFNVQEAFGRIHNPQDDFGPQSAITSTAHTAQDDLSYRPNV